MALGFRLCRSQQSLARLVPWFHEESRRFGTPFVRARFHTSWPVGYVVVRDRLEQLSDQVLPLLRGGAPQRVLERCRSSSEILLAFFWPSAVTSAVAAIAWSRASA